MFCICLVGDLVFKNTVIGLNRIIEMAQAHVFDYAAATASRPPLLRCVESDRWMAPVVGMMKLNSAAACRSGCGI